MFNPQPAQPPCPPGAAFGDLGEGYIRMALVKNKHRIRQALRQLGQVLGPTPATA